MPAGMHTNLTKIGYLFEHDIVKDRKIMLFVVYRKAKSKHLRGTPFQTWNQDPRPHDAGFTQSRPINKQPAEGRWDNQFQ